MPGRAQTHTAGARFGGLDLTKMFHVKHFGTIGAKNLTRPKQRPLLRLVRSIDFLVQIQKRGGGASMA
jgi:hypothetical protein